MIHRPLRRLWAPMRLHDQEVTGRATRRLAKILRSWEGTPYGAGQALRGVAGDCVRSTVSIVCEWLRLPMPALATLPQDAALHNRRGAIRGLHRIRRALPPHTRLKGLELQPGDIIVTGPPHGGPGHAIIVGTERANLWHTNPEAGMLRCGWALPPQHSKLFAAYRFDERERGA